MGEILVMFLALGEDVGSRMFPPPPPLPPLLLPSMPVLLLPDFLKSGTELTTQKYSTNLGTFSLSCLGKLGDATARVGRSSRIAVAAANDVCTAVGARTTSLIANIIIVIR